MNAKTTYAAALRGAMGLLLLAAPLLATPSLAAAETAQAATAPATQPATQPAAKPHQGKTVREAMAFISGLLGILLAVAIGMSLLVVVQLVLPGLTSCGVRALAKGLFRSFVLGLAVLAGVIFVVFLISRVSPPIAGLLALVLLALLGLTSFAVVSQDLGRRITGGAQSTRGPGGQLAIGWLVFVGASLAPVLGWFLIFPFLTIAGIGGVVQTIWTRKAAQPPAPPVSLPPVATGDATGQAEGPPA